MKKYRDESLSMGISFYKNPLMKIRILLFLLILFTACATRKISYNREKIIHSYLPSYTVFVDNEPLEFNNLYLDKENINNVEIDNKNKTLYINQLKKEEFLNLNDLLKEKSINVAMVIINGLPIYDSLWAKTKLSPRAIKSVNILKKEKMEHGMICRPLKGDFLFIKTD
ncbi:hypothetical protein EQP59_03435 [Ornithobacterium rhinotracheale]|uniref:Uncharacterized protein n=1 Tax=Ornithobacterium rhinotracheale TaxID=28251 RepID=A0A410JQW2_ORNRH|nr:hypothetical protein [Ornithobacterium rhinotracheale]QAR30471.1 hypothetical protein EQP59_03435 [Ornithobacterium rhinotracheale]